LGYLTLPNLVRKKKKRERILGVEGTVRIGRGH